MRLTGPVCLYMGTCQGSVNLIQVNYVFRPQTGDEEITNLKYHIHFYKNVFKHRYSLHHFLFFF